MKGKINYVKGIVFEQKFSIYMLKELGYDKTQRRHSMTGSESIKGSEADIIGIIIDPRGRKFRIAAFIALTLSALIFIGVASKLFPLEFLFFFLVLIVIAYVYTDQSKKLVDKYTWVECKNRKCSTDLRTVRDFYNTVEDYNKSRDKKYPISKLIFVSASGFVDNALQYASEKGIECYYLNDNEFQKAAH